MNKIISSLERRFEVELGYDNLSNSKMDVLYKVYVYGRDRLWVYAKLTDQTGYISLETEPDYLRLVDLEKMVGSENIKIRKTRPHLKIYFYKFDHIFDALEVICDALVEQTKDGYSKTDKIIRNVSVDEYGAFIAPANR